MPNWCECELWIKGERKEIQKFLEKSKGENGIIDFNSFIPYPKKYRKARDGYNSGGYEWCVKNWGTKWNACHLKLYDNNPEEWDNQAIIRFDTAWSPPIPVIKKMSEMFPNLTFYLKYFECGMGFHGIFGISDGNVIIDKCVEYFGDRGG